MSQFISIFRAAFALVGVLANKKRWNECLGLCIHSAVAVGEGANSGNNETTSGSIFSSVSNGKSESFMRRQQFPLREKPRLKAT